MQKKQWKDNLEATNGREKLEFLDMRITYLTSTQLK